jgi:acyl carrier protein
MSKVVEEVKQQLQQVATSASFGPETDLKGDLGLSSLSLVSVLTRLCETFNVDMLALTDADLARLDKVGDLIALFSRQPGGTAEP